MMMMLMMHKAGLHVLYLLRVMAAHSPKASVWPLWVYFRGIDVR